MKLKLKNFFTWFRLGAITLIVFMFLLMFRQYSLVTFLLGLLLGVSLSVFFFVANLKELLGHVKNALYSVLWIPPEESESDRESDEDVGG